jgi:hypothetical protein
MTDRPNPNPPAWVHTRLSNLEAAVGDLVVRLAALEGAAAPLSAAESAVTPPDGWWEPTAPETAKLT